MARLTNGEIAFYENTLANIRGIVESVKRLTYETNDPDILADLLRIAENAAAIKKRHIAERQRREGELSNGEKV